MPKPREYSETGRKKLAHGKGTRWCKRCGSYTGVIQEYHLSFADNVLGNSPYLGLQKV
jgi:ribosomal protein S14